MNWEEKLKDPTILSEYEYKRNKDVIPQLDVSFWLRTPADEEELMYVYDYVPDGNVQYVDPVNGVIDVGTDSMNKDLVARLAYHISSPGLKDGEKIEAFGHNWTVIEGGTMVVMDDHIGKQCFNGNRRCRDRNDYESSDIKKSIEEWAEEKRKEFVETVLNNAKTSAKAANDRLDTEATHEEKLPEKKVFLARTASNQDIFISQSTYDHMKAHPDVNMAHIVEAIGKINDYNGQFRIGEVEMDRVVGKDRCVEVKTLNRDDVKMRARKGRKDESVPCLIEDENHQPEDTTKIVIGMCNDRNDGVNTLFTAFYGQLAPKHLCDPSLSPEDRPIAEEFWSTHALVVTEDMLEPEKANDKALAETVLNNAKASTKEVNERLDNIENINKEFSKDNRQNERNSGKSI